MDDTVLPSSLLNFAEEDYYSAFNAAKNNFSLKFGFVKEIYPIDSDKNIGKLGNEYDVLILEQPADKGVTPIVYRNCVNIDSFGGIGDFVEFSKRVPKDKKISNFSKDDGQIVLLLCIDGSNERGVIIGAVPHHNRKVAKVDTRYEAEFNGVRMRVNKEGELTITVKGATDNQGVPTKPLGSQLKFEKDGSFEVNDREIEPELKAGNNRQAKAQGSAPSNDYEKIRIDKTKQTIDVVARKDISFTTKENINVTATKNANVKIKDLIASAEGKVQMNIKATLNIKADGKIDLKGSTATVAVDSNLKVQASQVQISAQQIMLGDGGAPALNLNTMMFGVGPFGIPVISAPFSGFSTKVLIAN